MKRTAIGMALSLTVAAFASWQAGTGTAAGSASASTKGPDVRSQTVEYRDGDLLLKGYFAYDGSREGKRPGILVLHEWWGLNEYPKRRVRELAQLGYAALAADIYGGGMVATNQEEAAKLAGQIRSDRALMRRRAAAGLATLKADPHVDPTRIAAIGYCFGGGCALELARSGAELMGVVSFHGNLDTPHPEATEKPRAAILVCHGAADPYVAPEAVDAFRREMNHCGADWQFNMYGEAVHSFTNPDAGADTAKGAAYNAVADQRSWEDMLRFFERLGVGSRQGQRSLSLGDGPAEGRVQTDGMVESP